MTPETMSVTCITSSGEVLTGDITGVKLDALLQPHNIEQRNYNEIRLFASDGYTEKIDRETFLTAELYMDEDGLYGISFKGMEKLQIIKNVISIEISE